MGTGLQGHEDGLATEDATIFNPSGIFMTADSRTYFVDSASCRVRRLTGLPQVVLGELRICERPGSHQIEGPKVAVPQPTLCTRALGD